MVIRVRDENLREGDGSARPGASEYPIWVEVFSRDAVEGD